MAKDRRVPLSFQAELVDVVPTQNPNISECTARVMYHGKNRNGSYISKTVAEEMAKSLPLSPVVGVFKKDKDDFGDHGEEIIIDSEGLRFEKKTVPYGVVAENRPIYWSKHQDPDGNEREYLTVTVYLWTGRYPEASKVIEKSKGQSMELFGKKTEGIWATLDNETEETYVINRAEVSALCILGDDIEPCFEGANISAKDFSFSLDNEDFREDFEDFMLELKEISFEEEGGTDLKFNEKANKKALDAVAKAEESKKAEDVKKAKELVNKLEDEDKKKSLTERLNKIDTKEEDEPKPEDEGAEDHSLDDEVDEDEESDEEEADEADEDEAFEIDNDKIEELFANYESLKTKYDALEKETAEIKSLYQASLDEKAEAEQEEKEALCEKFSALGEEVIEEFSSKLEDFTVAELEKELSALAFSKGLSFSNLGGNDNIITVLPANENSATPDWVAAIEKQEVK